MHNKVEVYITVESVYLFRIYVDHNIMITEVGKFAMSTNNTWLSRLDV